MALCTSVDDRAFIERIRAEENERAKAALIEAFVRAKEPLIRLLAEKYAGHTKTSAPLDDIHQAGRFGFIRSLEKWDPDKGEISTWAGWLIRRAVQDLAIVERTIKLPQIRATKAEIARVIDALHDDPDVSAAELGLTEGVLEQIRHSFNLRFVSVDMFGLGSSGDGGDDAPARARRIEKRITEAACPHEDPEDDVDRGRLASSLVAAARSAMRAFAVDAHEIVMALSRALGLPEKTSPHSRQPDRVSPWKTSPKTQPPPPKCPPLRLRPLQPPRALKSAAGPLAAPRKLRAASLRAPRALRSLPSLRTPRPMVPPKNTFSASNAAPRLLRLCSSSRPPSAPKSSRPSASSHKAA